MTDYIKREDAIEEVCKGCNEQYSEELCEPSDCSIIQRLADIPSADVVEVVRCKDCKYATYDKSIDRYDCRNWGIDEDEYIEANDFCSYGERADA